MTQQPLAAETRPWGDFEVLADRSAFKLKRLQVAPGHRLSLQRHRHRDEHWYVLQGQANVLIDGVALKLDAGESVNIPAQAWHRLANAGTGVLVLIEIQSGDYFGEDDIERMDDDYGRSPASSS